MPVGFILIQYACVFVLILTLDGAEMEANCLCCVCVSVWPQNHLKMSTQQPAEPFSGKAITAVAMWPQYLSVCRRKEAIFQSYSVFSLEREQV